MGMAKRKLELPLLVEKDEDGLYVVECPVLSGCYTQGKTLDEALKNIQEVITLCAEEEENRKVLRDYHPQSFSFHTITSMVNV
ncbi:MAG: type II toxin-antitoxin system HicB family antitoxin [Elusimicrobia bacterium]|nr:type II toxin-antitoxin system HicB family antitoxin [Elusimicrobiota bacterium]